MNQTAAPRILFLADGYASTTVAALAAAAEVSPETIYKAFGGKPAFDQAVHELQSALYQDTA